MVVTALLVLPLSGLDPTDAVAGLRAQATGTGSASSATWAAVATTASSAPYGTGPLTLSFSRSNRTPPPQYVNVVNTGSTALTSAGYTVTAQPAQEALLEACTGAWDERRDTCTGLVVVLARTGAPATSTVVPGEPGTRLRVRVRLTATRLTSDAQVTVDVRASNGSLD